MGTKKGLDPLFRNLNYYGTEKLDAARFWNELPYRVDSYTTIDDFVDQSGWVRGTPCVFPDGTLGREMTGGTQTTLREYGVPLGLELAYIVFDAYLEVGSSPMIIFGHGENSFTYSLSTRFTETGYHKIRINKVDANTPAGTPSWDAVDRISFRTIGSGTTIRVGNIVAYSAKKPLCTIWIDDACESDYTKAYDYMKTKSMRGVSTIISDYVGTSTRLTITQMKEMLAYGWEFVNHGASHLSLSALPLPQMEFEISRGLEFLLNIGVGKSAFFFVESGAELTGQRLEIEKRYVTARRQSGAIPYTSIPVSDSFNIRRHTGEKTFPLSTYTDLIDAAIEYKLWLVLAFHRLVDVVGVDQYEIETAVFQGIIDYLDTNKASIKTVTAAEALYYG